MSEILKCVQEKLADRQKQLEAELAVLKKRRVRFKNLSSEDELVYQINLYSGWAFDGEKHTTSRVKGSLRRAMKVATTKFKRVNKRSDVQGHCSVRVVFSDAPLVVVPIPEKFWREFFTEFGTYKSPSKS